MNKIKSLIIDDEKLAREIIKKYLIEHPEIEIAGECSNGFEAVKQINELNPDLIFLDIQMPKITGFELLELLEENPVIIFTTAFDQYALKAFEVNAADYLLKPFSQERFNEALEKAYSFLNDKSKQEKVIKKLINHKDEEIETLERIVIKDGKGISIIPVKHIKWIEAQDDYVMIFSDEGKFLKQKTMKFLEEHLPQNEFIRIHRSFICALSEIKKIESFEKESYIVITKDGTKLPVSKTGYSKLKEIIN